MGDYNIYHLTLQNNLPDLLTRVIEAAGTVGYSCMLQGAIHGFGSDGMEFEFGNIHSAQTRLYSDGGLITFGRTCESCENDEFLHIHINFDPKSSALSLSSSYLLKKNDWDRIELALDLRRLWLVLSHRLKPIYGYATTAWTLGDGLKDPELDRAWGVFQRRVFDFSPPPALFWANYFDWDYYDHMDKSIFSEIPHRKFVMPESMRVST
jgi:hypothetical protein